MNKEMVNKFTCMHLEDTFIQRNYTNSNQHKARTNIQRPQNVFDTSAKINFIYKYPLYVYMVHTVSRQRLYPFSFYTGFMAQ